jgi:hypothetical protein
MFWIILGTISGCYMLFLIFFYRNDAKKIREVLEETIIAYNDATKARDTYKSALRIIADGTSNIKKARIEAQGALGKNRWISL